MLAIIFKLSSDLVVTDQYVAQRLFAVSAMPNDGRDKVKSTVLPTKFVDVVLKLGTRQYRVCLKQNVFKQLGQKDGLSANLQ